MKVDMIVEILMALVAPLITTGVIKGLLRKGLEAFKGQSAQLGQGLKTVLGLGVAYLFFLILQAGFLGEVESLKGVPAALLALVSKAIYDGINDAIHRIKDVIEE